MLVDTFIFYADIYFVQNVIVKLGILTLTIRTLKIQMTKPVIKVVAVAIIATLLEITGLFFFPYYGLFVLFMHMILIPSMMAVLLWRQREILGKAIVCGYFYVILLNGVIEVLWNLIGNGWGYPLLVLTGNIICVLIVLYALHRWRISKGIYPVDIHFPDIIWTVQGFYDSGNHLKDPYTGKSVHIISGKLARRLELAPEKKVCIPYQSLGNSDGLIDVYYIDEIKIKKQESVIVQKGVPLAVAEESVFAGKGYEMIINEDVW